MQHVEKGGRGIDEWQLDALQKTPACVGGAPEIFGSYEQVAKEASCHPKASS
jgi:hypothetical protein